VDPVRGAGSGTARADARPASTVESRAVPPDAPNRDPDRSQHHTLSAHEGAPHAENGAMMQPVPQRDRGDGLAYTKRVSWVAGRPSVGFGLIHLSRTLDPHIGSGMEGENKWLIVPHDASAACVVVL
jgi:hypothetical protein